MNAPLLRRRAGAALLLAPLAVAMPARAQLVYSGFDRVDQSDATFVSITSADMLGLEAVPARSYSCTVAWGVRTSAAGAGRALSAGELTGAAVGDGRIDATVQRELHALLYGRGSGARIAAGLAPAGSSRAAVYAARTLVQRLDGLLAVAERMNPARPGVAAPTRMAAAVAAFDDYLDASSTEFLSNPSDELRGVHAVLTYLVNGGIHNNGRPEIRVVPAGGGLACALVGSTPHHRPQMSTIMDKRQPFSMCMVGANGPVQVYGLITSSNDSLTIVDGQEVPLGTAFPPRPTAYDHAWYHAATDPVVAENTYEKWARPVEMLPGSRMTAYAEYRGVTVYAAPGQGVPEAIYLPVGGCRFHEYRLAHTVSGPKG